ncbi:hypothetical protein [Chamaesiphon sp. VAR_48_metabat_135_sub]|nr:hypothetical protein [Chamaesiphon sp. VAR_48_metabat_135_sub]
MPQPQIDRNTEIKVNFVAIFISISLNDRATILKYFIAMGDDRSVREPKC